MAITVSYPRRLAEYRCSDDAMTRFASSFLELDLRVRTLRARLVYRSPDCYWQSDPGVIMHHVLRFGFDTALKVRQVCELLRQVQPYMEKLCDTYSTFPDSHGNLCGKYDLDALDDAIRAIGRIQNEIQNRR